jgi:type I restriction enzyme M protein
MLDKALIPLFESAENNGLHASETIEIFLQMLVWIKLSHSHELPEKLRYSTALAGNASEAVEILQNFRDFDGLIGQAFAEVDKRYYRNGNIIQPIFDVVQRLVEAGALNNIGLLDLPSLWQETSRFQFLTPEISDLLVRLADIKANDSVYTPWDTAVQLAPRAAARAGDVCLEMRGYTSLAALISLLSEKSFEVRQSDPIRSPSATENGTLKKFLKSLAFPPFGEQYEREVIAQDWYSRFPEQTRSGSVLAVRHLLAQTTGRVVVAVQNSLLFSAGAEKRLREDLVSRGIIQAVVAMPAGLIWNTNLDFSILVLSPGGGNKKIQFIDATTTRFSKTIGYKSKLTDIAGLTAILGERKKTDESVCVPIEDVIENEAQLQVGRYFQSESKRHLQKILRESKTVELDEIMDTIRPMPMSPDEENFIDVQEVGAADLPPRGYITKPGRHIKVDASVAAKSARQFLRPFDIVLIVKGSVGKLGIVPQDVPPPGPGGWVAGQSAIVLRTRSDSPIEPRALAMQLRSPIGQELLDGIVSGATIHLIQLRELAHLPVMVPSREVANRAIAALDEEASLQREIDDLRWKQAQVAAELWQLAE